MTVENAPAVRRLSLPEWRRMDDDERRDSPSVVNQAFTGAALAWSPERLGGSFADVEVGVRRRRREGPDGTGRMRVHIERAMLGEFVATMHPDTVYFAPAIPFDRLPGLLDLLDLERLFPTHDAWTEASEYARLHLGDSMRMRLHWEPTDLYLAQFHGRTRVIAEPPDSTAALYPNAGWPTASRADPEVPRHDTDFPLHTGEGRTTTVLEPGDVLHVPRGWWYQARAEGRAVWATVAHGPVLPLSDEMHDRLLELARRTA
jgi:hypothetical protein